MYSVFRTGDSTVDRNLDAIKTELDSLRIAGQPSGLNYVVSPSSGTFTTASTTPVTIITAPPIRTVGNPVELKFQNDGSGVTAQVGPVGAPGATCTFYLFRDGKEISRANAGIFGTPGLTSMVMIIPPASLNFTDYGASAGNHVYALKVSSDLGTTTSYCQQVKLIAQESV